MLSRCFLLFCALSFSGFAHATPRPALTVYTYQALLASWGPGARIKQAFEAQCACTLNWVGLDDGGAILQRLRLEGAHTRADVVLGLDDGLLGDAHASGLFAPHNTDLSQLALPGGWLDATFVPFDYGYFAFVFDSQKLATPPRSMAELLARPDLRVIYQDPRTSTPGQGLLLWLNALYGADTPAAWAKLAQQTVTVTKGWSEAYGLFLQGEADLVLSYTTSPAYHQLAEGKTQYRAAAFSEGHYRQVEVAGQLKSSRQPALAAQFLQFTQSAAFQRLIPQGNWMYPVRDVPTGFTDLVQVTTPLSLPAATVAREKKGWIRQWLSAVSR
ncbi:MAG: thiamine ABC transporter substrate binding subunit [Aeromonas sp.]